MHFSGNIARDADILVGISSSLTGILPEMGCQAKNSLLRHPPRKKDQSPVNTELWSFLSLRLYDVKPHFGAEYIKTVI